MPASTGILIVGYLLAVPPLFRLRSIWQRRQWWGYAPEFTGAALITAGWLIKGNTGAVIVNGAWALLFGLAFPLLAGKQRFRVR